MNRLRESRARAAYLTDHGVDFTISDGDPLFISGISGIELTKAIFARVGEKEYDVKELPYIDYPAEYWIGWIRERVISITHSIIT